MPPADMVSNWVPRFLRDHVLLERNLSKNTQRGYRDSLQLLLVYLSQKCRMRWTRSPPPKCGTSSLCTPMAATRSIHCSTSSRKRGLRTRRRPTASREPSFTPYFATARTSANSSSTTSGTQAGTSQSLTGRPLTAFKCFLETRSTEATSSFTPETSSSAATAEMP